MAIAISRLFLSQIFTNNCFFDCENYNTRIAASLKIKIKLKTAEIHANCDMTVAAATEMSHFYFISKLGFVFLLIKIITQEQQCQ